jgi:hypothetical protein
MLNNKNDIDINNSIPITSSFNVSVNQDFFIYRTYVVQGDQTFLNNKINELKNQGFDVELRFLYDDKQIHCLILALRSKY